MPSRAHSLLKRRRQDRGSRPRKRPKWLAEVIHHSRAEHHLAIKKADWWMRHSSIGMDVVESSAKRQRLHEARIIPGIDGVKMFGFPNSIITKLRYATFNYLQPAIGGTAGNTFAANSCFDPDVTLTGHQPMYYDDYSRIYDQYVVIGSKITVTFYPRTSASGFYVGIAGDDDSSVNTNLEALFEQNNSVSTIAGSLGSNPTTLSMTFEPQEDFGVDAKSDGTSQTAVGSNPSELWCWRVFAASCDQTVSLVCDYKVEIEYTVKFSELKTQTIN